MKLVQKDNGHIHEEMEERIIDALEGSWVDLGGGDSKFLPLDAAEEIKSICDEIIVRYEEDMQ